MDWRSSLPAIVPLVCSQSLGEFSGGGCSHSTMWLSAYTYAFNTGNDIYVWPMFRSDVYHRSAAGSATDIMPGWACSSDLYHRSAAGSATDIMPGWACSSDVSTVVPQVVQLVPCRGWACSSDVYHSSAAGSATDIMPGMGLQF